MDAQAARRGAPVRRRLVRRDRAGGRADRGRARRGQRRLHRLPTTAGSTSPRASTRARSRRSRTWTPPSGGEPSRPAGRAGRCSAGLRRPAGARAAARRRLRRQRPHRRARCTRPPAPVPQADVAAARPRCSTSSTRRSAAYTAGIPLLSRDLGRPPSSSSTRSSAHRRADLADQGGGRRRAPRAAPFDLGHPRDAARCARACCTGSSSAQIVAYLRAIPRLSPGPVRAAAAAIFANDAQHVAVAPRRCRAARRCPRRRDRRRRDARRGSAAAARCSAPGGRRAGLAVAAVAAGAARPALDAPARRPSPDAPAAAAAPSAAAARSATRTSSREPRSVRARREPCSSTVPRARAGARPRAERRAAPARRRGPLPAGPATPAAADRDLGSPQRQRAARPASRGETDALHLLLELERVVGRRVLRALTKLDSSAADRAGRSIMAAEAQHWRCSPTCCTPVTLRSGGAVRRSSRASGDARSVLASAR